MKRTYYAVQGVWGTNRKVLLRFKSMKARNEYVNSHDFINSITAAELKCYGYDWYSIVDK
jgi:uncharacterized protein (DUF1330 family)